MRWIVKLWFFKILNWNISGNLDPSIKKCVVIIAPHTSWYDFFIGAVVRKILGIQVNYLAKKELFKPPFGWYFKWMGGTPLDRDSNQKKVDSIAKIFAKKDVFRLAMSPEGTREKTERWKSGFYYIAKNAGVPIIMVALDYSSKNIKISLPFYMSKNFENDMQQIQKFYSGVQGRNPENF